MKRKGVNYDIGIEFVIGYNSRPTFEIGLVHREIEIIKDDLHCNTIRISGTNLVRLIVSAEDALKQGLKVWITPNLFPIKMQKKLLSTLLSVL